MNIRLQITGTSALLMHGDRLADKSDPIAVEIKKLTAKGKHQTDEDQGDISKLEFRGSAYVDENNEVVIPSINIIRCLRDAAAITKQGKTIARSLSPHRPYIPLETGGARNINDLWKDPAHVDRRMVKVQSGRVKRTRPIFPKWGLVADFFLLESVLDFSMLTHICEIAGLSTGLGDARILGYGRFECKLTKVK